MTGTAEAAKMSSPWTSIWIRPRQAIRQIVEEDSSVWLFVLAGAGGVITMLQRLSDAGAGESMALPAIAAVVLLGGPVAGIIGMYIIAAILSWTGRWFGGQAHSSDIAAAFAWSNVVQLPVLLLYAGLLAALGLSLFSDGLEAATLSAGVVPLVLAMAVAMLGFQLWSAVIFIVMLAGVQRFSLLKALLSVIAPGAILVLVVAIIWLA